MKFIKAHFDDRSNVIIEDKTEIDMELAEVIGDLILNPRVSKCYLALPSDLPNRGNAIDPEVSRSEYLSNPAKYGVAIYKNHNLCITYE